MQSYETIRSKRSKVEEKQISSSFRIKATSSYEYEKDCLVTQGHVPSFIFLYLNMMSAQVQGLICTSTDNSYKIQARLTLLFDGAELIKL